MRKPWQMLLLFVVLLLLPVSAALANSAPPSPWTYFDFIIEDTTEEMVYFDVLLPMDGTTEDYTECNLELLAAYGLSPDCDLASYREGDAAFLTAHWTRAESFSDIKPGKNCRIDYAQWERFDPDMDFYVMRVGLFDAEGNLILLSEPAQRYERKFMQGDSVLHLDAATGELLEGGEFKVEPIILPIWLYIAYWVLSIQLFFPLLLTLATEMAVSAFFKLRTRKVFVVNFLTNPPMCVFLFFFVNVGELPYWPTLIVVELLVLVVEFLLYRKQYLREEPAKKLLTFVCTANVASFVVGMLLWTMLGSPSIGMIAM